MDLRARRLLSLAVVCGYLFLGGVEYAVIFPTAWEYIQTLGVHEEYLLGVTVAAYSLSAAIAGVIGGRWSDRHPGSTKPLCLLCIVAMSAGSLQYVLGGSVWNVIASRCVCGVGTAAGAALLAYVCHVTSVSERTAVLSVCNATRQMGILMGPAFQFFLTFVDFQFGPVHVTRLNAAGVFMALLWLVFLVLVVFFFSDITQEWHHSLQAASGPGESRGSSLVVSLCESVSVGPDLRLETPTFSQEILRDTVMALMGTVFTLFFGQILAETLIPIYMKDFFLLGDVATSFMYMALGFECLVLLLGLVWLSRFVPDWALHLFGLVLVIAGFCYFCATLPYFKPGDASNLSTFVTSMLLIGAGYPITSVANASLLSKAISDEAQGTGQGLRRLMSYLGLVLGPMWAGASASRPSLLMGVTLALVLLMMVLYLDCLPRMIRLERAALMPHGETTPLVNRGTSCREEKDGVTPPDL